MTSFDIVCCAGTSRHMLEIQVPEFCDKERRLIDALSMICAHGVRQNNNILQNFSTAEKQQIFRDNTTMSDNAIAAAIRQGGTRATIRNTKRARSEKTSIRYVASYNIADENLPAFENDAEEDKKDDGGLYAPLNVLSD